MAGLLPPPLLDLLSNTVIINSLIQYLPLASLFSLARTSKPIRDLLLHDPNIFRYIDLSRCRGAYTPLMSRMDTGGNSWRAERMDENLTEDEFYAGPLRGVLQKLKRMQLLSSVHTLVLDGLSSVTNDLLNEIITGQEYNIRLLSIRRCLNVNQSRLQLQLLYLCRPSRQEGTPRLQGLYVFTDPGATAPSRGKAGVTATDGAQLGAPPTQKLVSAMPGDSWYLPFGQIMQQGHKHRTSWEETVAACKGLIWFDTVVCQSMHSSMAKVIYDSPRASDLRSKAAHQPLATIALGADGCDGCGFVPSDAPKWGRDELYEFPLLWPPPHSGNLIDALRPPRQKDDRPARLVAACSWCMDNRHCESCARWWCASCYDSKNTQSLPSFDEFHDAGLDTYLSGSELQPVKPAQNVKVLNGFCIEHCFVAEHQFGGGGGMWG